MAFSHKSEFKEFKDCRLSSCYSAEKNILHLVIPIQVLWTSLSLLIIQTNSFTAL